MKTMILLVITLLLMGCEPTTQVNKKFVVPPELADCKFFDMYDGSQNAVVVRCPHSDASVGKRVSCGKNCWRVESTIVTEEQ